MQIRIPKQLWVEFQAVCADSHATPSEIVRGMIREIVGKAKDKGNLVGEPFNPTQQVSKARPRDIASNTAEKLKIQSKLELDLFDTEESR